MLILKLHRDPSHSKDTNYSTSGGPSNTWHWYEISKNSERQIVTYPTAHVAPLLANVQLSTGQSFDADDLETYQYEMIGGNHSREVFQMLVTDPIHRLQKCFHSRLAAVYTGLRKHLLLEGNTTSHQKLNCQANFKMMLGSQEEFFLKLYHPRKISWWILMKKMRCCYEGVLHWCKLCKKVNKII